MWLNLGILNVSRALGYELGKRGLDLAVSLLCILLISPILLFIGILVRMKLGSPVLFRQERAGQSGCSFLIFKFRTMTNCLDSLGNPLPDEERITAFGKFLRERSLDELPQFLNVVRGDMSLVGPRPLPVRYIARYSPEHRRRLECLPGITGWAQVNGRNSVDWMTRLSQDIWYVEHRSMVLDLRILVLTIRKVLLREDVHAVGHATMPEFEGPGNKRESNEPREQQ